MKKKTALKIAISSLLLILAVVLVLPMLTPVSVAGETPTIQMFDGEIDTGKFDRLDGSVAYKLPDSVSKDSEISLILSLDRAPLLDEYELSDTDVSFSEYAYSEDAEKIKSEIKAENLEIISALNQAKISYGVGASYYAIMSGFEITVKAGDFERVCHAVGNRADVIVSEVYNVEKTELVENNVNVYDTGIFDSSDFGYDGSGMVVAVLDTGLDYDHSAFSTDNFSSNKLGLTFDEVSALIKDTQAYQLQSELTASDVYISEKVPFGFDYADGDSDVFPIQSDHGTHVAGIIAGKDDVITGVAPNAQLVIMKTFSDVASTARASWILSALDDCVILGVDVINMSLGTACGFSRESDKEQLSGVYDRIREAGIGLIVAASNNYNSTYSSDKNGNLGLTSNPDSGTVGSPGTYKGAMSVASISGVKTPYLLYGDTIVYFNESTDRVAEERKFVDGILSGGETEREMEYITIPGAGRSADYTGIDVTGKIVLVKRGSTTFEEKANIAEQKGAAGIIIYNNVSGEIKMNVGDTKIPACSIRQDDGELLAAAGSGTIKISRSQSSGPFMSDFSSWGPTPDLQIKPEITAHGGSILSSVPGQSYDRISGTSMACPNMSGVTALLRQYVVENFPEIANKPKEVTALVNCLMMSTADIVYNVNGLPYSVRKQGAGLANLNSAAKTPAYITTFDRLDRSVMDKAKIELGDDPEKTGEYTLEFAINNFGNAALEYDLSAYVMTEGVSDTKTNDGKTTVTEQGYILDGAKVEIAYVSGGSYQGNTVSVGAGKVAYVTVTITLSDTDKAYLDSSFANGMYVEGFVTLKAKSGTDVDLSVPYLAFYGDWTVAPIFDLDYFATNKDELDDSIDPLDKTLPDAYATRPVGGLSSDYVSYLGSYYFTQAPTAKKISADRKYISLSNQTTAINSLRFVWAGLLRSAARVDITVTDDATGEVVFSRTESDIRKSYSEGAGIYPANIDVEFSAIENNLKNNTRYTVTLKSYLDYGDGGEENNLNNEFSFPLVADFEAPAITDCEFYTEYDKSAKKTRLYVKMAVYDNHYSMAMNVGYVGFNGESYVLNTFDQYATPTYSEFNTTSYVVYELTDYIDEIRRNSAHTNSIIVACYDYAVNEAIYEINLPDDFKDFYFEEESLTLSPNEIYTLTPLGYPDTEWTELLEYHVSNDKVARIVNNKVVAIAPGTTQIIARNPETKKTALLSLTVLGEEDEGYVRYDKPVTERFELTGYRTDKAYYFLASEERDIGMTGDERKFVSKDSYSLSMYPSEAVTLRYILEAYFPDSTDVVFESSNENLVTVDENGKITAVAEGFASVSVSVTLDGESTYYSKSIDISIKNPYVTTGPSLTHYFGNGGVVELPEWLAITEIGQYAFSNYDYIEKDENDEISDYDPNSTKIWYIGDDTIEEVIIPEGVKTIGPFAFANLTALKKVVLPSTLEKIDQSAFYNCEKLEVVVGLENVKFINQHAFYGCNLTSFATAKEPDKLRDTLSLDSAVAIANYAFADNPSLAKVSLPEATKSVGAYAFAGNRALKSVEIGADKIKLGAYAFMGCSKLTEISLNAAVLPAGAFDGCSSLKKITLGRDVSVIGEYALRGSNVKEIIIDKDNPYLKSTSSYITSGDGTTILLAFPSITGDFVITDDKITSIASGAFSGNNGITSISAPHVSSIGNYAFADCSKLESATFGKLTLLGDYAFFKTKLAQTPELDGLSEIGASAFEGTALTSVTVPDGVTVGDRAFADCMKLEAVTVGNNVTLGSSAFAINSHYNWTYGSYRLDGERLYYYIYTSPLHSLTIGEGVNIGNGAFMGAAELESVSLGQGATIGNKAFYNAQKLKNIDLSGVISIGEQAFSGDILCDYTNSSFTTPATDENGNYIYRYFGAALESIDLSGAVEIGKLAFANCPELKTVALGEYITVIPDGAFQFCKKLTNIDLSTCTSIGPNAFEETALESAELTSIESIGSFAFLNCSELVEITLGTSPSVIGEGAFSYCGALAKVNGLSYAKEIGNYAFAYSALTSADLSGAEIIGDHAFIKESVTDFTVKLGASLEKIGNNPFAMCRLPLFEKTVSVYFNGKEYTSTVTDFDISDSVTVIGGMLYRRVPSGLELVSYAGDETDVKIADGTVRISAWAFAGSGVERVTLPYTLASIGHKALYKCDALTLVAFTSYNAPVLEEEYDPIYYASGENIPATGEFDFTFGTSSEVIYRDGLGIVPYFMWNVADMPTNYYYGATFVDYIGHIERKPVMARPSNGLNYDSFIFDQYFSTVVEGTPAADAITLAAIAAIDKIPENITLDDKAIIEAARAAYDRISTAAQRVLVINYTKLTQAENRIADLEFLENPPTEEESTTAPEENTQPDKDSPSHKIDMGAYLGLISAVVVLLGFCIALTVILVVEGRRRERGIKEKSSRADKKAAKKAKKDAKKAQKDAKAAQKDAKKAQKDAELAQSTSTDDESAQNDAEQS